VNVSTPGPAAGDMVGPVTSSALPGVTTTDRPVSPWRDDTRQVDTAT